MPGSSCNYLDSDASAKCDFNSEDGLAWLDCRDCNNCDVNYECPDATCFDFGENIPFSYNITVSANHPTNHTLTIAALTPESVGHYVCDLGFSNKKGTN